MLAYARHGRTVAGHLIPAMKTESRMASLATTQLPQELVGKSKKENLLAVPLYISIHQRNFEWPHGKGRATDLTIYHLWFDCN